jgi:hypothetical protein
MSAIKLIRRMEAEGLIKFLPIEDLPIGTLDALRVFNSQVVEILKGQWRGPQTGPINRDIEFDGEYMVVECHVVLDERTWEALL